MKKLFYSLLAVTLIFSACEKEEESSNNTGNNSSATTYTWYFEVIVNGVVHRVEGSFNNTLQTSSGIMNIVSGSNTTFISLNSSILIGKSKAKGENTYVSGENFDITLSNTNISLGLNDFSITETLNQLGVEGYGGWGSSTVNGFSAFSLTPVYTNTAIFSPTIPVNITQLPSTSSFNSGTGLYDVGNPIIGSCSATIYTLDTISSSFPVFYSYSRPYNIEINFKTYAQPY